MASSSNIKLIVLSSDVNFLTVNKLVHTIETLVYAPAVSASRLISIGVGF